VSKISEGLLQLERCLQQVPPPDTGMFSPDFYQMLEGFRQGLREILAALSRASLESTDRTEEELDVVHQVEELLWDYEEIEEFLQGWFVGNFPELEPVVYGLTAQEAMIGPKALGPAEDIPPRYANYEFFLVDEFENRAQVGEGAALREKQAYDLEAWIGGEPAGLPFEAERRPIRDPGNQEEVTLYVLFEPDEDAFDFDPNDQLQTITLPPAGQGDSSRACFRLSAKDRSASAEDLPEVAIHFFYHFNAVERLVVQAEVVGKRDDPPYSRFGLERPIRAEYLRLGDWVNLDELEKRRMNVKVRSLGSDRFQLTFLYEGVRFTGALRLTKEDLEDVIVRLRAHLEYLAVHEKSPIKKQARYRFKDAVRELAGMGRDLWVRLFLAKKNKALWHVGQFLQEHPLEDGAIIQVLAEPDAAAFVFPWNILYDGKWPLEEDAGPEEILDGFWGMRYSIEQFYQGQMERWRPKPVQLEGPLTFSLLLRQELPNADAQRELVTTLVERSQEQIVAGETITAADACFDLLTDCPSHILDFFSIGFTRRRVADMAYAPATPLGELGEPQFERSYIRLSRGDLYLDDLYRVKDQIYLREEPLVILNMCESGQIVPSLSDGFIPFFLEQGARAVIGTECPMTACFAHPFAEALLFSLLGGDSLGQALLKARRQFLQPGEFMAPLGLAYTLYGPATVGYEPSPLGQGDAGGSSP